MSYEVQIVADSVGPNGVRITTFALKYPRMVHAELMTHRQFSRNASSTRAIPTAKLIEWVEKDPAMPVYWGKNQRGMQATEELPDSDREWCEREWIDARDFAVERVKSMIGMGVHKQIAGRILEPWMHINVVVTATDFNNFFALRCHKAAMPEIQALAYPMARAYRDSVPKKVGIFGWHLPFIVKDDLTWTATPRDLVKASVARCARVSYKTFEGKEPNLAEDIALHDRLLESRHMSPFEHAAQATDDLSRFGNFVGWRQYRKVCGFDQHTKFDFSCLDDIGGDFSV